MAMAKMITGAEIRTAAAPSAPHWMPYCVLKPSVATGAVAALELVSVTANRNSVHNAIKEKTAEAATPPAARGSTILRKTVNSEHPSIIAASRSSRGISRKKLRVNQIEKGKLKATLMAINTW